MSIKRRWTADSVFALKESDRITREAAELAAADGAGKKAIAFWNTAKKALFEQLSEETQNQYMLEAAEWNDTGPGMDWKPL